VRLVLLLAEVAAVLLAAYLVYSVVRAVTGRARPAALTSAALTSTAVPAGPWQVHHYADGGLTVVVVARLTPAGAIVEQHVVEQIPDADPDWTRRFLGAKQEAEERAFHLNAE
jgi:hypothetical protein